MKTPEDYLKDPYSRVIIPDEETGSYTAQIIEFPGCIAEADTLDEAYKNLEEAAKGWIQAALDMGQTIPQPSCETKYSGKIALRITRTLHRQATQLADREGVSLNQFLATTIAEKVGSGNVYMSFVTRMDNRLQSNSVGNLLKNMVSITTLGDLKNLAISTTDLDKILEIDYSKTAETTNDIPRFSIGQALMPHGMELTTHG